MMLSRGSLQLHYEVSGEGRPLVMLHGNGEDMSIFARSLPLLEKHFRVCRIDTRGHGGSSAASTLHYSDIAEDAYALTSFLDPRKPVVYGFSDGGIAALILAYTHPDAIDAIAVSGANTSPKGLKLGYRALYSALNAVKKDEKLSLMLREPHITAEDLGKIAVPALVIAGERDAVKLSDTRFIASSIPRSRLMILPGESHGSYIIGSEKIGRILIEAFAGNPT